MSSTTAETAATTTLVEREVAIAARPETVWPFLVEEERMVRWMGVEASIDARPGGELRVEVCPGQVARGTFVELDPPRRAMWTWGWEPESNSPVAVGSTTVEIELVPDGDAGTLLRFRHSALPDAEAAASHAHGWDHYLPRLVTAAGGGDPGPDPWAAR